MAKRLTFILYTAILLILTSCESEYQTSLAKQEEYIDSYIAANYSDCEIVFNDGVNRIVVNEGSGSPAEEGDIMSIYCAGYTFGSSGPESQFTELDFSFTLGEDPIIEGLELGLAGARAGETCVILFTAKHGYGQSSLGVVPEATALAFLVYVKSVSKQ